TTMPAHKTSGSPLMYNLDARERESHYSRLAMQARAELARRRSERKALHRLKATPPFEGDASGELLAMTTTAAPRRHLLLPCVVQEREGPVLEFDHADGVYFYDRHGRKYLDFLAELFNCNLGHGNRRVIEAIQRQADKACCVSPQFVTEERVALA